MMLWTEGLSLLPMLLGSSFIATAHWLVPSFTTGVLWARGKDSSHLISFYFLDALAEYLPVFVISGLSLSFLEMEQVSSFMEVVLNAEIVTDVLVDCSLLLGHRGS